LLLLVDVEFSNRQSNQEERPPGGPRQATNINEGRTTDRHRAVLLATTGQLHGRQWATSHGHRHASFLVGAPLALVLLSAAQSASADRAAFVQALDLAWSYGVDLVREVRALLGEADVFLPEPPMNQEAQRLADRFVDLDVNVPENAGRSGRAADRFYRWALPALLNHVQLSRNTFAVNAVHEAVIDGEAVSARFRAATDSSEMRDAGTDLMELTASIMGYLDPTGRPLLFKF